MRIGLGALPPGMARLAGETADVAIMWLTPASYIRDTVIPALREGAEQARRQMPKVTVIVPMALSRPEREPAELALASNAAHIKAAHYIDILSRAGVDVTGDDPLIAAKALVDGGAFLSGDIDRITEQMAEYTDAGVDEIVLNLTGVYQLCGPQATLTDLKTILAEVA
ncbi:LLM class flavin-dependent oxidoreductase [Streptosporangium amethystogenes]|uniref:LLM class flavin-dependent oxidoreductase n=1 Tax=Streptosporangium amethystogenes TaxID=2002 RepID=UPI00068D1B1B|nr:LLM class flavin-dependent oxidoreductase [Streptosporangium amethystogenes]